jgi:flagellar biosynthesis/type III secretory pathway protein FliH
MTVSTHIQITIPHYSDDAEVQAQFSSAYLESYRESYEAGRLEGVRESYAQSLAEGEAEGALAQRERCAAIITAPEARGREKTARALALETDLPADQALALLRSMPVASSIGARQADVIIKH